MRAEATAAQRPKVRSREAARSTDACAWRARTSAFWLRRAAYAQVGSAQVARERGNCASSATHYEQGWLGLSGEPRAAHPLKPIPSLRLAVHELVLGTGGDNSDEALGIFYEGAMTAGYASVACDDAIQANIVAAGYKGAA